MLIGSQYVFLLFHERFYRVTGTRKEPQRSITELLRSTSDSSQLHGYVQIAHYIYSPIHQNPL